MGPATGFDDSGGTVTLANQRELKRLVTEIREVLGALDDYPSVNDEALSPWRMRHVNESALNDAFRARHAGAAVAVSILQHGNRHAKA